MTGDQTYTPSTKFKDINGKEFLPTVARLAAHELGHGFVYIQTHFPTGPGPLNDRAVDYENIISRQMDPGAPTRAISDHGHSRNYLFGQ